MTTATTNRKKNTFFLSSSSNKRAMATPSKPPSPELQAFLQQEQAKAQVRKQRVR
jgi:hypothetical protein